MKIYQAINDEGEGTFYGTKGGAVAEARRLAKSGEGDTEVMEYEVMPGKAGIVALANGYGWSLESTVVETFKAKKS